MAINSRITELDEERLIKRCLSGDQTAWAELVTANYRVIASVIRSPKWRFGTSDREDLMQEALEELVKSLPNYKHQAQLKGFIQTIAFRQCSEHLKKILAAKRKGDQNCEQVDTVGGERENPGAHIPVSQGCNPLDRLLADERVGLLKEALARLEAECKKLIRMRFFEDLSFQEMARFLGLKENTIAVKVGRCVQKLRPFMNSLL
jgi:RNA polymerase sigma factor (sigma-70 family)